MPFPTCPQTDITGVKPRLFRQEPGWAGAFTREHAEGALRNGTRIVKHRSDLNDRTPDGTPGIVLGSVRDRVVLGDGVLYFVAWASAPRTAVGCLGRKLRATLP